MDHPAHVKGAGCNTVSQNSEIDLELGGVLETVLSHLS